MKKIYIIDDDPDIVDTLRFTLEKAGYEVAFQNDGKDVVENLQKFEPDCLVLDVMFPDNESAGFEIARLIRQTERLAKLPILMLSAVNEKGGYVAPFSNKDRDDSFFPVNEFVEKPINQQLLLTKVAMLVK